VRRRISEALQRALPPPVIERTVLTFGLEEVEAPLGELAHIPVSGVDPFQHIGGSLSIIARNAAPPQARRLRARSHKELART
jgi:hypothetical protein